MPVRRAIVSGRSGCELRARTLSLTCQTAELPEKYSLAQPTNFSINGLSRSVDPVGITVRGIDRSARTLRVDGETDIGFDLLALTTGARPRRLPAALGGSAGWSSA